MSANLFNNRGGRRTKQQHVPEDHEGFALAVALVMNLVKHTDATHPQFYDTIARRSAQRGVAPSRFLR